MCCSGTPPPPKPSKSSRRCPPPPDRGPRPAAPPAPLEPCDAVMLDGFLCGVLVQPVLIEPATWLPHVFDFEGQPLPDDVDAQWLARTESLILRRHAALNRAMVEDGWFNPLILEFD